MCFPYFAILYFIIIHLLYIHIQLVRANKYDTSRAHIRVDNENALQTSIGISNYDVVCSASFYQHQYPAVLHDIY